MQEKPKLTDRQQQILDLVQSAIERTGAPPTRAEIAAELGFKSANAAEEHLQALARKGVIELVGGTSRGIRLKSDTLRALAESRVKQFSLPLHAVIGGIERLFANGAADLVVELRDQTFGRGAGLILGVAHHDVDAVAEFQLAAIPRGAGPHVGDGFAHLVHRVGPHQVDVAALRRTFARFVAQAAEIERGRLARQRGEVFERQRFAGDRVRH